MKTFDILGFIAELGVIEHDVKLAEKAIVAKGAEIIAKKARAKIGKPQEGWPALAPSTIKDKAAHGYATPKPLLRTGELRDSITYTIVSDREAWIGSELDIAQYQEEGTSRIPPRPFLVPAAQESEPRIHRLAERLLAGAVEGRGPHARELKEVIHALHQIGHAIKDLGDEVLNPHDENEGKRHR